MDAVVVAYALVALATYMFAVALYVIGQAAVGVSYDAKVTETSIGFGPLLFQTTLFSAPLTLRAIPLGGYTRFFGDTEEAEVDQADRLDRSALRFYELSPLGRLLIYMVGPVSSAALGGLFLALPIWLGVPALAASTPAESVVQPCSVAGLAILDEPTTWRSQWQLFGDTAVELMVRVLLFRPTDDWGGPFSLYLTSGLAARQVELGWFTLMGVFLVGAGLVNLLPVPSQNGFHLVCLLYEVVVGRPLAESVRTTVTMIALLFVGVMAVRLLYIDFRWIWNNIL